MGKSCYGTDPYFDGEIASMHIWNRALLPTEVEAIHAQGMAWCVPPPPDPCS